MILTPRAMRIVSLPSTGMGASRVTGSLRYSFWLTTTRQNEATGQTEKINIRNYYCRPVEFEGDVKFEDAQITPMMDEPMAEIEETQRITFWPNGTAQSAVVQIGDEQTHYTIAIVASTGRSSLYFGPADEIKSGKNVTIDLDAQ